MYRGRRETFDLGQLLIKNTVWRKMIRSLRVGFLVNYRHIDNYKKDVNEEEQEILKGGWGGKLSTIKRWERFCSPVALVWDGARKKQANMGEVGKTGRERPLSHTHTQIYIYIYKKKQASDINLGECCRGNNSSSR